MAPVSPYATALKLERPAPAHITNELDQHRVQAYWTYTDIFYNVEDAFVAVLRDDEGNEDARRFIPVARSIIEAVNRYLAKDVAFTPDPLVALPDGTEVAPDPAALSQVMKLLGDFVKREEVMSKFLSLKRWMLVRGDACWHIMADDTKPEGTRLRLEELDPAAYFPILDAARTRIVGCHIVTIVDDDEGDPIAQRQTYRKQDDGSILSQLEFFEEDGWDDRPPFAEEDLKPVAAPQWASASPLLAGITLPSDITSLPVYHYRNNRDGNAPFGRSQLQGIETVLAGINQTATDEDQAVGLQGIGVYWTTSGRPRDILGNEQEWIIAPAAMIELEDKTDKIGRVEGATNITSLLEHTAFLQQSARESVGIPDVAVGKVDVKVAESGIALAIQMAPLLSGNEERELEIKTKTDQMLYDIVNMWLPAFEGLNPMGISVSTSFGDPLPLNRKEILEEIVSLVANKLVSIKYAQQLLQDKMGYVIPADELTAIANEQQTLLDPIGGRLDAEVAGGNQEV